MLEVLHVYEAERPSQVLIGRPGCVIGSFQLRSLSRIRYQVRATDFCSNTCITYLDTPHICRRDKFVAGGFASTEISKVCLTVGFAADFVELKMCI